MKSYNTLKKIGISEDIKETRWSKAYNVRKIPDFPNFDNILSHAAFRIIES